MPCCTSFPICHSCLFSPRRAQRLPAKTALLEAARVLEQKDTPLINLILRRHHEKKINKSKCVKNTGGVGVGFCLLLSRALKSPFVSCSKMAAVGNKKTNVCWYLVYVAVLRCVYCAESHWWREHLAFVHGSKSTHILYMTFCASARNPARMFLNQCKQNQHAINILFPLPLASSQATQMPNHIFLWYQMRFCFFFSMELFAIMCPC